MVQPLFLKSILESCNDSFLANDVAKGFGAIFPCQNLILLRRLCHITLLLGSTNLFLEDLVIQYINLVIKIGLTNSSLYAYFACSKIFCLFFQLSRIIVAYEKKSVFRKRAQIHIGAALFQLSLNNEFNFCKWKFLRKGLKKAFAMHLCWLIPVDNDLEVSQIHDML